ncbi:MAG: hypothetical protein ACTSUE_03260, partial [Promethearchaeota archaeon]
MNEKEKRENLAKDGGKTHPYFNNTQYSRFKEMHHRSIKLGHTWMSPSKMRENLDPCFTIATQSLAASRAGP